MLSIRPLAESDYLIWKDYVVNRPKPKNRWADNSISLSEASKSAFKKIVSTNNKHIKNDFFYQFAVIENSSKKLIGFCSLMDISRGIFHNAYVGYQIGSEYWGQGYGKELLKGLIELAFMHLKLHRIEAGIEPRNIRSTSLARSLGFRKEGVSKRRLFVRGEWRDMSIYALTIEETKYKNKKFSLSRNFT